MSLTERPTHLTSTVSAPPSANRILLAASGAAALVTVMHIVGGGIDIARPVVESSIEDEPRLVMFGVWHMTSVALGLSALALLVGALPRHQQPAQYLTIFVGVLWVGFALCFVGVGLTQPGGDLLRVVNQWILLLPPGLLALWGARRNHTPR